MVAVVLRTDVGVDALALVDGNAPDEVLGALSDAEVLSADEPVRPSPMLRG
jgi:hypothetical protein